MTYETLPGSIGIDEKRREKIEAIKRRGTVRLGPGVPRYVGDDELAGRYIDPLNFKIDPVEVARLQQERLARAIDGATSPCRRCDLPVVWAENDNGKRLPWEPRTGGGYDLVNLASGLTAWKKRNGKFGFHKCRQKEAA